MPVTRGEDSDGAYYQWGSQKKYRYKKGNEQSRKAAKAKAEKQGRAVRQSQSND